MEAESRAYFLVLQRVEQCIQMLLQPLWLDLWRPQSARIDVLGGEAKYLSDNINTKLMFTKDCMNPTEVNKADAIRSCEMSRAQSFSRILPCSGKNNGLQHTTP